jgi:hypothetical protein
MRRADRGIRVAGAYALVAAIVGATFAGGLLFGGFRAVERSDYMTYQVAARLVLGGQGTCLYEASCQARAQRALIGDEPSFARGALPYNSPPTLAALLTPVGALPLHLAFAVFTLASLAVLAAGTWALSPSAAGGAGSRLLVTILVLSAWPTVMGAVRGQLTLLVAGLLGLSAVAHAAHPVASGALAGLSTLKPTLAPLWFGWLLLAGRWRALATALAVAAGLLVLAGLVAGPDAILAYPEHLLGVDEGDAIGVDPQQMVNWRGAAARLALPQLEIAGVAATLALVAAIWWQVRSADGAGLYAAAAAFLATPLIVPHANQHEAILASLGVVALLSAAVDRRGQIAIGAVATHAVLWSGPLMPAEASAWLLFLAQLGWLAAAAGIAWQRRRYHRPVPVPGGTG